MPDLNHLFAEFVEADLAGDAPDPWEYIDRLEGPDRDQLEELIDEYFVDAPLREWDPEAFRGSEAERLTDELDRSFRGRSGLWPAVLPRLRDRVKLKRRELVERLADALGVGDRADKIGAYYHEMEQGRLPADGVTDRVLEALAGLLGTSAEGLRRAGRMLSENVADGDADAVFARTARHDAMLADEAPPAMRKKAREKPPDEVDDLFTGRNEDA